MSKQLILPKQLFPLNINLNGIIEDKVMELLLNNLEKRADTVFAKAPVYVKLACLAAIIVVGKIVELQQAKVQTERKCK